MNDKQVFEAIILILCVGGSGVLFYGIGVWASGRKDPMHFWAGSRVDPKTIRDIPAYNRANGIMWKQYSVPYFLGLPFAVLGIWFDWAYLIVLVLLVLACTVGFVWLFRCYRKIEKTYIIR